MNLMKKTTMKRYSEAFKQQVVSEYEAGQGVPALRRKYGITGNGTIERWVKRYGHAGLRHELVVIQRPDERQREKMLERRVKELESAVAQLTLEKIVLEASLLEAEQLLGVEVKKNDAQPLSKDASSTH
jgi:transposase-like protein